MRTKKILEKDKAFRICKNDYEYELVSGHRYLDIVQDASKQHNTQRYLDIASDLCNRLDAAGVIYEIEYGKPKEKTYARLIFDNPVNPKLRKERKNRESQDKRQKQLDAIAQELGYKSWGIMGTAAINKEIRIIIAKNEKPVE